MSNPPDILRFFLDTDQVAGFNIIVSVVPYQFFDGLPGFGAFLNLIQDNDRFARDKRDIVVELKSHEDTVKEVGDIIEKGGNLRADLGVTATIIACFSACAKYIFQ